MELTGQRVLVLGLGLSGRSAARFCADRGARVVAADERPASPGAADARELATLPDSVEVRTGAPFPDPAEFDLVVPSPGIPAARWADRARRAWGDIELCSRALEIPFIAVTGTNGKSTVVRLIEAMACRAGLRARAAGNLGLPALDLVGAPLDLAILEVSSFQLESVDAFRPRVGVWLNMSPDHLDRHGHYAGYIEAKTRLFANQSKGDAAVLNADDEIVSKAFVPDGPERLAFSRRHPQKPGAWLDGRRAIVERAGKRSIISLEGSSLVGSHNDENILAALLSLAPLDIELETAGQALAHFEGLPHRCQRVAELRGVTYVDDSKATNPGAAARALAGIAAPIVWIAGGRHKGGDLLEWAKGLEGRIRCALLIGEAAEEFERVLSPRMATERVGTLEAAVTRAAEVAEDGDIVLLAPACASFDQFKNFEDRGQRFQSAVHQLGKKGLPA